MAPSSVLVSSPRRSHQPLSQMKSSMFGNNITSNSNNRRSTASGSPPKRLFNDENSDPSQHSKRVKSATHILSKPFSSNHTNENPKQTPSTKQSSRFILTDRAQPQKQQRTALGNVTNTHHRVEKSKPRVGSSLKHVVLNTSPPRRRPATPPRSARERRVPFAVRVDPPVILSECESSSINSVLRDTTPAIARPRSLSLLTPNDPLSAMPDSWEFTIYEDTPTETLQNMMEHSTNTLDISDDESSKSELGKENIPPIVEPTQMSIDALVPSLSSKRSSRSPLREMEASELEAAVVAPSGGMPTLEKEAFMTITTPEKKKASLVPRAKSALRFSVWTDPVPAKKRGVEGGKKRGLSEI